MEAALEVRAPFAGVVARRHVDAGADVQPGTPLFTVRSSEATEIEVPVPEAALPALEGARLAYQVGDGGWRPAHLARVDGMTDFTTRTRTAHLVPAGGPAPEPGAFARVRLESVRLPDPSLPRLPSTSLVRRGSLTGAFVIEEGHAVLRWLKLGREQGGMVEVLSGLFPGERVARIAAGLADGVPVRVES
jgi:multidrug efflux pump subunit AcrA (membrane-fusion protein)